jgi:hypothetical protein
MIGFMILVIRLTTLHSHQLLHLSQNYFTYSRAYLSREEGVHVLFNINQERCMSRTNIRAYDEEEVREVTKCCGLIGFHTAVLGPVLLGRDVVAAVDGYV